MCGSFCGKYRIHMVGLQYEYLYDPAEHFDMQILSHNEDINDNTVSTCRRDTAYDPCNTSMAEIDLSFDPKINLNTHFKQAFVVYCRLHMSQMKSFRFVCVT